MALENAYLCGTMVCDGCGKQKHVHFSDIDPDLGLRIGHNLIHFIKLIPIGWKAMEILGSFPPERQILCSDCQTIKDIIE
jgi:hypothetical protein